MLLEMKDIHKNFGNKQVLKGISFSSRDGSAFGLLGRNGAGKTTTIRILMNVFSADNGAVEIDGKPVDYRQIKFGYLPEERGMYPKRKVKEQLVYAFFFLLGFFIYAFLYGATGSTVTKLEEVGQATMPVTLIFVVGFLVTVQAMSGDTINSFLVKVFSFIPFTSPMVIFARIAMSVVPAGEIAVSVAILIISAALVGVLSAKIYRAGVLIYGTRPKAGTLIKTVLLAK